MKLWKEENAPDPPERGASLSGILSRYAASNILPPCFNFQEISSPASNRQRNITDVPLEYTAPSIPPPGSDFPALEQSALRSQPTVSSRMLDLMNHTNLTVPSVLFETGQHSLSGVCSRSDLSAILLPYTTSSILPPCFDFDQHNRSKSCNQPSFLDTPNINVYTNSLRHSCQRLNPWSKNTTLESLPSELLHGICRYLGPEGLQSFRLLCKYCAAVGLEYLATEAFLCTKQSSFASLVELSKSDLARKIKSLHFAADRYTTRSTYDEWLQTNQHKDSEWAIHSHSVSKDLHSAWFRYRQYFTDQVQTDRRNIQRKVLRTFFKGCPNLDTVRISAREWQGRLSKKTFAAFKDALCLPGFDPDVHTGWTALSDVMLAARLFRTPIKHLMAAILPVCYFCSANLALRWTQNAMTAVETLALNLSLTAPVTFDDAAQSNFREFLTAAPQLRCLRLAFPVGFSPGLDCIIGRGDLCTPLPHLKSLHLETMSTSKDALEKTLMKHKGSLRSIELIDIDLSTGTAVEFLQSMSTKLPRLRSFKLYGHLGSYSSGDMSFSYLLRGRSSIRTHAVDKYLRKGGICPVDKDDIARYVPKPRRAWFSKKAEDSGFEEKDHIEEPDTDTEDTDEDADFLHPFLVDGWDCEQDRVVGGTTE